MSMRKQISVLLAAPVAVVVAIAVMAAGAQAAPQPVHSEGDRAAALANRVEAITDVVAVMGARITRIGDLAATAPGPPNEPLLAAQAHALAIADLAEEMLCPSGDVPVDSVVATEARVLIADDDRDAEDSSATGLANQAYAVAAVLAQAQHRLAAIVDALLSAPGPPNEPEAAALTRLYVESAAIVDQISTTLGLDLRAPPNPC